MDEIEDPTGLATTHSTQRHFIAGSNLCWRSTEWTTGRRCCVEDGIIEGGRRHRKFHSNVLEDGSGGSRTKLHQHFRLFQGSSLPMEVTFTLISSFSHQVTSVALSMTNSNGFR